MLDLNLIKPGDLITLPERTYVHLVLELTSKVTDYYVGIETLDALVLDQNGNIIKDILYSDLDQLVI